MKKHPPRNFDAFYEAIASIETKEEAQRFFEDLCTPAELEAMNDRWQVLPLVQAGQAYRDIHDATGVSVTTIGRVARALRFGTGGYTLILNRRTACK